MKLIANNKNVIKTDHRRKEFTNKIPVLLRMDVNIVQIDTELRGLIVSMFSSKLYDTSTLLFVHKVNYITTALLTVSDI